ncbi:hypothetical protein B0H21DRAFT_868880 [Amylocystis lapponica]|nr:hypothetical protein B0H21DRAFT_868880 [Amylocystis lapponica]
MTPNTIADEQYPDFALPYPLQYPYPSSEASATPPPVSPIDTASSQELFTTHPCASQYSPSPTDSTFSDNMFMTSLVDSPEYPPPPYSLTAVPEFPGSSIPASGAISAGWTFARGHCTPVCASLHQERRQYEATKDVEPRPREGTLHSTGDIYHGAPHRRTIYTASLEAHVDRLHAQLIDQYSLFPVPFETLDCFHGLNSKTAKSMVAGLYRDATELRLKRLELQRSINTMRNMLLAPPAPHVSPEGDAMSLPRL